MCKRLSPLSVALVSALGIVPVAAQAARFTVVTDPDDTDPTATTTCTLRQAIVTMNNGSASLKGNCKYATTAPPTTPDTIVFYDPLTGGSNGNNVITLADNYGTLTITDPNLTIKAIANSHVTIQRSRASSDPTNPFRILDAAGTSLTLDNLTIRNGNTGVGGADAVGGGIRLSGANLTLNNSTVENNYAYSGGGGIHAGSSTASVTLSHSTVSGNAVRYGGGGGIYNSSGTLGITASTISSNGAPNGGGVFTKGNLSLSSSTVSGNTATAAHGGGIYATNSTIQLSHTTVANNAASFGEGLSVNGGSVTIDHSILAQITNSGHSLIQANITIAGSDNIEFSGTPAGSDPKLGPLQNNGGPTLTMLPGAGSAAIDADSGCPSTDQRGIAAPQGSACDIGAVEVRQFTLNVTAPSQGSVSSQTPAIPATGSGIDACTADGGGSGTCVAAYAEGATVSLVATPAAGYHLDSWGGNCAGSANPAPVILDGSPDPKTCSAAFAANTTVTTLSLTAGANPSTYGDSLSFTAAVAPVAPATSAPSGNVSFYADGTPIAGCNNLALPAVCTTSALTVSASPHAISAQYHGDGDYLAASQPASDTLNQVVNQAASATMLSTACMTTFTGTTPGQPFTLSAQIAPPPASTSTITFKDNGNVICGPSVPLAAGQATANCTTTTLSATGSHALTAGYAGDGNHAASNATALPVSVLDAIAVLFRNGFEAGSLDCPVE